MSLTDTPLSPLPDGDTLLSTEALSQCIGIAPQTLTRWRHEGQGPEYFKLGHRVFYKASTARQWIEAQRRSNTCT